MFQIELNFLNLGIILKKLMRFIFKIYLLNYLQLFIYLTIYGQILTYTLLKHD